VGGTHGQERTKRHAALEGPAMDNPSADGLGSMGETPARQPTGYSPSTPQPTGEMKACRTGGKPRWCPIRVLQGSLIHGHTKPMWAVVKN
jgi:hypothetical protein